MRNAAAGTNRPLAYAPLAVLLASIACAASANSVRPASGALDTLQWFVATPGWLRSTGVDRPELRIDLKVARTTLVPGDSLELVAVAQNLSGAAVQVGRSCGPAMDVRVTAPTGQTASAIKLRFAGRSRVAFTCELGPYHFAQAHDSLVNRYWWRAPALPGRYFAVAGARFNEGLADESIAVPITVR
jgi:hypothetical protein